VSNGVAGRLLSQSGTTILDVSAGTAHSSGTDSSDNKITVASNAVRLPATSRAV
jgi:hypothetical protein